MNWPDTFRGKVKGNEPLWQHTSFRIGGRVKFWLEPRDESNLGVLLACLRANKMRWRIIGCGSNILASSKGLRGAVIKLNSPAFKQITQKGSILNIGAGVCVKRLLRYSQERGLGGLELLAGIPASLGGTIIMNSADIGRSVEEVKVMDNYGKIQIIKKKQLCFGYRSSNLASYIILAISLKLIKRDKEVIKRNMKEFLYYRRQTQDLALPSAGCIFKNPPDTSASFLIERCGLKGKTMGGAMVSRKHANFIVNKGKVTSTDVLRLIRFIRRRVKASYNILLEPEIKIWN
ncbi:MAG: UDP-N-acetylmuramate dehydrogenase [Candidatus Omnitrophica bacterium]|nr:UDP-N-acetylmuramate dehydrogenase [Candidatus Omnitrophota bacterium]